VSRVVFVVLVVLAAIPATAAAKGPDAQAAGESVEVQRGVVYGRARIGSPSARSFALRLDLYQPARRSRARRPVVVLIHGGGFVGGSRSDGGIVRTARGLAADGAVVASIDYRLLGQAPVPSRRVARLADGAPPAPLFTAMVAAVDDTLTATDYLRENARRLHIDTGRLGIAGSSAGAVTANHVAYILDDYRIARPRVRFVGSLWGGVILPPPPGRGGPGAAMLERGEAALFAVHGDADPTVPVALDDQLVARAKAQRVRNEYHRIAGGTHGYAGARFFTEPVVGRQTSFDRLRLFARSTLR
jgi:dienelactone hydrolase